jgi:DNA mismatch endonuclease, patch repair protein
VPVDLIGGERTVRIGGPVPTSPRVSARFSRHPRRDTIPEVALRRELFRVGLRYRVDAAPVRGLRRKADVVFPGARVAVFVDGCFWHGCPEHVKWPKVNVAWWRRKIEGNQARDRETDARLAAEGWTSLRVWEHEAVTAAAGRVLRAVRRT